MNDGRELQVAFGSVQHINSPNYLISAFPTNSRKGTPDKANNPAVFDSNHVSKYFVEMDGSLYPRDAVLTTFEEICNLEQYRDLKIFYEEYVGEELLLHCICYPDMKTSIFFK